jgi:hypothetical protein
LGIGYWFLVPKVPIVPMVPIVPKKPWNSGTLEL